MALLGFSTVDKVRSRVTQRTFFAQNLVVPLLFSGMMPSQAWIQIVKAVLVLSTIAIAIVLVIERINAATSRFSTTSQPVEFARSEPAGGGTFRIRLRKPVLTERIFPSQIRLIEAPGVKTWYTPRGENVERFGNGLFTIQKNGWLVLSMANELDPRTVAASGELVTPRVFSTGVARLLGLFLITGILGLVIVCPAPAFAPGTLWTRSLFLIRVTLTSVGQYPAFALAVPSFYFLLFYPPLWKDIDALSQLVVPASVTNIFHFPAIYCFLARIPIWIGDCLTHPRPLDLMGRQWPSLSGIYFLVILQHAALVSVLAGFCRTISREAVQRGIIVLMFAASSSLYAQAQTCGSEAWSLIAMILVYTLGLRIYYARKSTALSWLGYVGALTLAIGSRHVDVLLGFWLIAAFLISGLVRIFFREAAPGIAHPWWRAGFAVLAFAAAVGVDTGFASLLARLTSVEPRTTLGRTLSDRINTFLGTLPEDERKRLAERLASSVPDGDVKAAILDQATIGSFYDGTGAAISRRLAARGYQGEALGAKTDSVILDATMAYLRSLHPKLVGVIERDFWDGLWRATNSSIAVAPFENNRYAAEVRPEQPDLWRPLDSLRSSFLPEAIAWGDCAAKDGYVSSGKRLQLGWPFIVAVLLCIACYFRHAAVPDPVILSLSVMATGLVIFAATVVCVGFLSRYALPLQLSGLIGVSLALAGLFRKPVFTGLKARLT